jgi:hypothetical protein
LGDILLRRWVGAEVQDRSAVARRTVYSHQHADAIQSTVSRYKGLPNGLRGSHRAAQP